MRSIAISSGIHAMFVADLIGLFSSNVGTPVPRESRPIIEIVSDETMMLHTMRLGIPVAAVVDEDLNHRLVTRWFGIDRRTVKMALTGVRSWRTWSGPDGNRRTRSSCRCIIRRAMPRWILARRRWKSGAGHCDSSRPIRSRRPRPASTGALASLSLPGEVTRSLLHDNTTPVVARSIPQGTQFSTA